ncbi:hypothetical protein Syun_001668 [Stephania yunnanensis]|uniref:Uncharacterized protein n=1 Tax=Stephania yunnanensis TaxID=152371 RepID=A0AAP0LE84_9MAGN
MDCSSVSKSFSGWIRESEEVGERFEVCKTILKNSEFLIMFLNPIRLSIPISFTVPFCYLDVG